MKNKIIILIYFFHLFNVTIGLQVKDVCYISKEEKYKCDDRLKYSCSSEYCVANALSCEKLNYLSHSLKSFKTSISQKKRIQKFLNSIIVNSKCKHSSKKILTENICFNNLKCTQKLPISSINNLHFYLVTKKKCECKKEYPYKCKNEYCSIDEKSCENFFQKKLSIGNVKTCANNTNIF